MSAEKIINEWKKGVYKPIYWLEGEEAFYIDKVVEYAEHHILSESEAGFNLTIFYGERCRLGGGCECLYALSHVCRTAGGIIKRGAADARD